MVTVDRGRWGCVLGRDPARRVTAMRARELGRTPIVVGDDVDIVGDLSGRTDTLARIVRRGERRTVLRRTADDTDPSERVFVANADQLLIVVALADPPPRTGLVERALIAAFAGGLVPILCLTKTDLAAAEPFTAQFSDLDLTIVNAGRGDRLDEVVEEPHEVGAVRAGGAEEGVAAPAQDLDGAADEGNARAAAAANRDAAFPGWVQSAHGALLDPCHRAHTSGQGGSPDSGNERVASCRQIRNAH